MDVQSPASVDSRRKRRRYTNSDEPMARRASETASSTGELGSMRRGHAKGSSSFVGSGSGIYFVHTVQAAFARNCSRQGSESINEDLVPGEDDRLHSRRAVGSLWTTDEVENNDSVGQTVSFDEMITWSQAYFDNWHPPFPFLLGSNVLSLFEKVSISGVENLSSFDAIVVRSVLSISLADRRQMPKQQGRKVPSTLIFSTVDDAISCLTPLLAQPSTLYGLQALVAIQLFLISMLYLNAASRIGGLIVRILFHLGLHRCPAKYDQFSMTDVDLRKRLFWTVYVTERYLSQSLGLPLDLKDDDIDVCYPDQENHRKSTSDVSSKDTQAPDPRVLLLPSLLARHGKIRGLTLELRHIAVKNRVTDPDEVAQIEAEISKWWNEAQDLLDPHFLEGDEAFDQDAESPVLEPSHKLLLVVQKHESTILLNRPVISSGQNNSLFSAAMQKCIGASKQIVSKVYQHLQSEAGVSSPQDGRLRSPLFWPGFTWCIWMSGLILVYAASEGHYSVQVAQKEAERCVKILDSLSLRSNFWPGACATALRDLQKALQNKLTSATSSLHEASRSNHHSHNVVNNIPLANVNGHGSKSHNPTGQDRLASDSQYHPMSSVSPSAASISEVMPSFSHSDQQAYTSSHPLGFSQVQQELPQSALPQHDFGQNFPNYNFEGWQTFGLNANQGPVGEVNTQGFNDIFQLMDVSYQMSEQMYEPGITDMSRF